MTYWYFRLADNRWGYVYASSKADARRRVREDHGETPVYVALK